MNRVIDGQSHLVIDYISSMYVLANQSEGTGSWLECPDFMPV